MKIKCTSCGKDISSKVCDRIEKFEVGQIECDECHTIQKRYISEADLLLYFGNAAIFYCILLLGIYFLYNLLGVNFKSILIIFTGLVLSFFVLKQLDLLIYEKAWFHKDLKEKVFEEDAQAIEKRMKWQFILFMLVALMMGSQPSLFGPFLFLLIAFIVIIAIKFRLVLNNQREELKTKGKK